MDLFFLSVRGTPARLAKPSSMKFSLAPQSNSTSASCPLIVPDILINCFLRPEYSWLLSAAGGGCSGGRVGGFVGSSPTMPAGTPQPPTGAPLFPTRLPRHGHVDESLAVQGVHHDRWSCEGLGTGGQCGRFPGSCSIVEVPRRCSDCGARGCRSPSQWARPLQAHDSGWISASWCP